MEGKKVASTTVMYGSAGFTAFDPDCDDQQELEESVAVGQQFVAAMTAFIVEKHLDEFTAGSPELRELIEFMYAMLCVQE